MKKEHEKTLKRLKDGAKNIQRNLQYDCRPEDIREGAPTPTRKKRVNIEK